MENENSILNLARITKDDVMNNRLTKTDMVCCFECEIPFVSRTNAHKIDPLLAIERFHNISGQTQM